MYRYYVSYTYYHVHLKQHSFGGCVVTDLERPITDEQDIMLVCDVIEEDNPMITKGCCVPLHWTLLPQPVEKTKEEEWIGDPSLKDKYSIVCKHCGTPFGKHSMKDDHCPIPSGHQFHPTNKWTV